MWIKAIRSSGYLPVYGLAFLCLLLPYGFVVTALLIAWAVADMLFGY